MPAPNDPFEALGLPARFELDGVAIERAYLARVASLHPDIARGDPDAARRAAAINDARRVLDDAERRANALLARLGGPAKDQEKALPPGFLAEMMEVRESIDAAIESGDFSARGDAAAWALERRARHAEAVAAMFNALSAAPDADELRAIRTELNAWRYTERLLEQLRDT